jgi:hypothetical protein
MLSGLKVINYLAFSALGAARLCLGMNWRHELRSAAGRERLRRSMGAQRGLGAERKALPIAYSGHDLVTVLFRAPLLHFRNTEKTLN